MKVITESQKKVNARKKLLIYLLTSLFSLQDKNTRPPNLIDLKI
jgi:hypothetical protein